MALGKFAGQSHANKKDPAFASSKSWSSVDHQGGLRELGVSAQSLLDLLLRWHV